MIIVKIILVILAMICFAGLFVFFLEIKRAPLIKEDEDELMERLKIEDDLVVDGE